MKNIALLVIDVQKVYSLNHSRLKVNNVENIVENINKIIRYFENKNLPIIYIRHIHNPDGSDAGRMYDFSGKTSKIGFIKGSLEAEYIDDLIIIKGAPWNILGSGLAISLFIFPLDFFNRSAHGSIMHANIFYYIF